MNKDCICADDIRWDDKDQSIEVKMAPLSLSILRFQPYTEEELEKVIADRIRKRTIITSTEKAENKSNTTKTKSMKEPK